LDSIWSGCYRRWPHSGLRRNITDFRNKTRNLHSRDEPARGPEPRPLRFSTRRVVIRCRQKLAILGWELLVSRCVMVEASLRALPHGISNRPSGASSMAPEKPANPSGTPTSVVRARAIHGLSLAVRARACLESPWKYDPDVRSRRFLAHVDGLSDALDVLVPGAGLVITDRGGNLPHFPRAAKSEFGGKTHAQRVTPPRVRRCFAPRISLRAASIAYR
jgi:hypothetical protein